MKVQRLISSCFATACCVAMLVACGGDDDPDPTSTSVPPVPTETSAPLAPTETVTTAPSPTTVASPAATTSVASPSPIAAKDAPVAVSVILTDFRVSAFQKEFVVGQTYTLTIQNNGSTTHRFVIEPEGAVNQPISANGSPAVVPAIPANESATLIWTFTEAGSFQFACHEPGHFEQGMVQTGVVVAP